MGDGRVALILDVLGLAQSANVVGESRERTLAAREQDTSSHDGEKQTMLLFECGVDARLAMELSLVARLEEFRPELIEKAGDRQVVQYRGEIMPLVRLVDVLQLPVKDSHEEKSTNTPVVVYTEEGRSVGLVVDRILDIVEESFVHQRPAKREGLLGSAVIQQKVTDLLDVQTLIRTAIPDFFEQHLVSTER
jgi:two-component system, chemotaxis family, sensor kinase CheA